MLSFNARRHNRAKLWLYQAKIAYHARQIVFIVYAAAGTLIAPELVFSRLFKSQPATFRAEAQRGENKVAKQNEIDYIKTVAKVDKVNEADFRNYLVDKPFSDPEVGDYLMDIGQILKALPPRPARVLDLGVGSGWTSEMIAKCGYEVVGLDISQDMIELAKRKLSPALKLQFSALDYEQPIPFGQFDAVVMYDSLHHAVNERAVIRQLTAVLKPGGRFICLEPGKGHASSPLSVEVMRKYGTTEKDMPFSHIRTLLAEAGFSQIQHYVRLRQLPLIDLEPGAANYQQIQHFVGLMYETVENGLTSLVVAYK